MVAIDRNERDLKRRRSHSRDRAPAAKKQRQLDHPDRWVPSGTFWDSLPEIYLTRRALDEYNRRLRTQEKAQPLLRRSRRLQQPAPTEQSISQCTKPGLVLQRFARHGGPDLTAVRGCPDPTMSRQTSRPRRQTTSSRQTPSSKRSGPYDPNYRLKLAQVGILATVQKDENNQQIKPANYSNIINRLNDKRPSLSPSRFTEQDFENFQEITEQALLETETISKSVAIIEGDKRQIYSYTGGPFNNLESFDPELAIAAPDSYDGAPPLSIDHRILSDLDWYFVPNTDTSRPALPNFFLEVKSSRGRANVAKQQASYIGAIGARAIQSLKSWPSQVPQYDNNAYSFMSAYHDGTLKMYTSHISTPPTSDQPPQYHTTLLNAFAMTGKSDTFREGASYYRNARDLAKEQRDAVIHQANQMARQLPIGKHGRNRTTMKTVSQAIRFQDEEHGHSPDTETSTDELALDNPSTWSRNGQPIDDCEDDASQMSFTAFPTVIPAPKYSVPASRAERTRSTELSSSALLVDASEMTYRMSAEADVQTSKQTAKPDLMEIHAKRVQQNGIMGRELSSRRRKVFVPDGEWLKIKKSERDAWVNWERRVYCFDD